MPSTVARVDSDRDFAHTLVELVRSADAVVLGTFTSESTEQSRSSDDRFIHLAQQLDVEEVLLGDVGPVETLPVLRTVTASGEPVVEFEAEPVEIGQQYVLILKQGDGVWFAVGGPQGQLSVDEGRLHPLSSYFETSVELENLSIGELRALLSALLN